MLIRIKVLLHRFLKINISNYAHLIKCKSQRFKCNQLIMKQFVSEISYIWGIQIIALYVTLLIILAFTQLKMRCGFFLLILKGYHISDATYITEKISYKASANGLIDK